VKKIINFYFTYRLRILSLREYLEWVIGNNSSGSWMESGMKKLSSNARQDCLGAFVIAKSNYYLRHVCPSVCVSAWNNSDTTGRILMEFDIRSFVKILSRKFKFH